ncbi:MAG: peptidylprolyl isomerase [candidate division Zixibacteria bacterium]|nr:peptidylprolyl isomerase [candidate division Zixibacteria bacterium]
MFETLRRMIKPIIFVVLILFAGLIVLEWGYDFSGRTQDGATRYAGVINEEPVTWEVYQRVLSNLISQETQRLDADLTDTQTKQIEQQAWNQLLQSRLLAQQAKKHSISVTNSDVYTFLKFSPPAYLQNAPTFQTNGTFDYQKYLNALADPQYAAVWQSLDSAVRNDIRTMKMQQIVIEAAQVSDAEIRQAYIDSLEKVTVALVNVPYSRFAGVPPVTTEAELLAQYEKTKDNYKMEERVSLNAVISDNLPSEFDWEVAKGRADKIRDSIQGGADFGELAAAFSEDATNNQQGGDLGWFGRGIMVPQFDSVAFSIKEGELSRPVRTDFGWHLLLHKGFRDVAVPDGKKGETTQEANVAHILIKAPLSPESEIRKSQELEKFAEAARSVGFTKAAEDAGLSVRKIATFYRDGAMGVLNVNAAANTFAFENPVNTISDVITGDVGNFVIQVAEKMPAGTATFEEVKARVKQEVVREKIAELCKDTANAIYTDIQSGSEAKAAAEKHNAQYQTLEPFNRNAFVAGLGRDPKAIGAAFALKSPNEISPVVEFSSGAAILQLIERTSPDLTGFNDQKDSLRTIIRQAKQQELYGRWFDKLIKSSSIENNTNAPDQISQAN